MTKALQPLSSFTEQLIVDRGSRALSDGGKG
jgi:hypothetical protein